MSATIQTTVAFIGLGNMGGPMASNVLKAGFKVQAFDLSETALAQLAAEGAKAKGQDGKYIIEITNTTRQPALAQLENRELRQQIWEASAYRGTKGETDNRPLVARLAHRVHRRLSGGALG